jgi:3-methylcrotonyl-CoA carboxylase alpha subunit
VTEEITGVDLVEWQLRVASGEPLPLKQEELSIDGWAMEARLYAEDPVTFLPSIGQLKIYRPLTDMARIETGYSEGDEVSPFYDPMIEKLVVHAPSRTEAAESLAMACRAIDVWPVKTNAPLLWRALRHPEFLAGDVTTGFIEAHKADLSPPAEIPDAVFFAGAVALAVSEWYGEPASLTSGRVELRRNAAPNVWREAFGFRLNRPIERGVAVSIEGETEVVDLSDKWRTSEHYAERVDGGWAIPFEGQWFFATAPRPQATAGVAAGDGAIISPMPGKIIALEVAAGDAVTKGQKLLTLEAMKMEHSLVAPFDGIVAELNAEAGAQVSEGALLVRIEKGEA